jgi:hypothetical protein
MKRPVRFHSGAEEVAQVLLRHTTGPEWETHEVEGLNLGRTRWQRVRIAIRRSTALQR